jgi:uncharacterized protein YcaQ
MCREFRSSKCQARTACEGSSCKLTIGYQTCTRFPDPVVWDRAHFQLLWGWEYRFEAYTPPAKRKRGYYALPLLWRDRVIGWGNLTMKDGALRAEFGYVGLRLENEFKRDLGELERIRVFLGLEG